MTRYLVPSALCILFFHNLSAQNARLHIKINHSKLDSIAVMSDDKGSTGNIFMTTESYLALDQEGTASYTLPLKKPQRISFFNFKPGPDVPPFGCTFYLRPGDSLSVTMDPNQKDFAVTVTGKGSENNAAPFITWSFELDMQSFSKDSLPYQGLAAIRRQQHSNDSAVKEYFSKYRPSRDRSSSLRYDLQYYTAQTYYDFMANNKYFAGEAYQRNLPVWKAIRDSIFSTIRLSNDDALTSYIYRRLLNSFLLREKERLWLEERTHPDEFYKEWYGTTMQKSKDEYDDDQTNALQEKIINRYFKGRTAQYLYSVLFNNSFEDSNPKNTIAIFDRFSQKYPNSEYISWVKPYIDTVRVRQKQPLNAKMNIVPASQPIFSFSAVLEMVKGKTVLLDMWGTWCAPCRNEIQTNSQAIKDHFAGKGLDYLYIANFDQLNEKNWKELIAYFHLEGTHILAQGPLTKDIMDKVKGSGYPTYIIIKKDGSYELSKAGYPMDRDVLIRQLEAALNE
jgi:thiol-disulfide isomerase/thioredoxin